MSKIKQSVDIPLGIDHEKLGRDAKTAEERFRQAMARMEKSKRIELKLETALSEKKLSELRTIHEKLVKNFQQKLALDVDARTLGEAKTRIEAVEKLLKRLNDEVNKPPSDNNTLDRLAKLGMVVTGLNQAVQLIGEISDAFQSMVNSGLDLEVLRSNFQGSAEDMELFRKATAGTVSEAGLIKLSNQATDLGLTMEEQALAFSLADDAADKYGGSVEENFEKVVAASEGQSKGLKALGIQKEKYEQIVKDLTKATGQEIDELEADTQKHIRMQAVIRASGITLEDVKSKVQDNKDKLDAMGVAVEEAKTRIGRLIGEGLVPLIDAFRELGVIGDTTVAVGSLTFQMAPLIASVLQLTTLQKLLKVETAAAAVALEGEAAAATTAATASKGFLASLGFIVSIGAALGILAGKTIDYYKDSQEAARHDSTYYDAEMKKKGAALDAFLAKNERYISMTDKVKIKDSSDKESDKLLKNFEIRKKIEDLKKKQDQAVNGSQEDKKLQKEIEQLEKKLNIHKTETNALKAKAELEKKLISGLNKMSIDYYEGRKAEIRKEVTEMEKAGLNKVRIKQYELEQYRKMNQDFEKEINIKAMGLEKGQSIAEMYNLNKRVNKAHGLDKMQGVGDSSYKEKSDIGDISFSEMQDDIINFSESTRTTFDSLYDGISGFFDQVVIKSDWANSMLEQGIVSMANTFIKSIGNMIAKWAAFQAVKGLTSLIPGFGGLFKFFGAADGGAFRGGNGNVIKLAGGGSGIVPGGFPNDSFGPFMLQSDELFKVYTPMQQLQNMRDYSSFVSGIGRVESAIQIMNANMTDRSSSGGSQNLSIGVYGELKGQDIHLADKKAARSYERIR